MKRRHPNRPRRSQPRRHKAPRRGRRITPMWSAVAEAPFASRSMDTRPPVCVACALAPAQMGAEPAVVVSATLPDDLVGILFEIGPLPEHVEVQWTLEGVDGDALACCRATAGRGNAVQSLDLLIAAAGAFAEMLRAATTLLLFDDLLDDDGDIIPDHEPYLVIPNDPEFWQDIHKAIVRAMRPWLAP